MKRISSEAFGHTFSNVSVLAVETSETPNHSSL